MVMRQLRSGRNMKTVMWIVAASFLVGFVFLSDFRPGGGGGSDSGIVGSVNGSPILDAEYRRQVNALANVERGRVERDELSALDYERLEDQIWERLVSERLVRQEAARLGLWATDEEVVARLMTDPPPIVRQDFTDENGQFDFQLYQQLLNDPNFNWVPYENAVRRDLPLLKLTQMVYARATASEAEVREEYARRELRVTVRYVGMRFSDVDLGESEPEEAELRRFYNEHLDVYTPGEQVILDAMRIDKAPSAEDRAELLSEARSMIAEIGPTGVSNFAALAEIYSEDPSARRGGDIGWTARGFLPEPVAAAAWELDPGQHTDPIEAERGLYIVHVDSVRTDAAGERELYLRQLFLRLDPGVDTVDSLQLLAQEVAAAAREDFGAAAAKYAIPVEKFEPFGRTGSIPGFGYSERLRRWAFEAEVGAVEGPFGNDEALFILRLAERPEPSPQPFEEVRSRVEAAYALERRKELVRQKLHEVHDGVREGATLADAAARLEFEVARADTFTYYEGVPEVGSNNEFTAVGYALVPGQTSGVIETSSGAYIVELVARDPFDEEKYREVRDTHYQSLVGRRATQIYQAWLEDLRERAEIVDNRRPRV